VGRALSPRVDFAERILAAYRKAVDAFFETGGLLIESKESLEHGEFLDMVECDLPFSTSTAERLMKIASDQRLAAHEHAQLPPRWTLLHAMTQLDDDQFAKLNVMTIRDVEEAKGRNLDTQATILRFEFPLPPAHNEQLDLNSKFTFLGRKRVPIYWLKHKEFEDWCDNLELAHKLPPAPPEPWSVWRIESAEFTFAKAGKHRQTAAKRDPLELYCGLKWPVDWLVKRGYVKGDSLSELMLPLPAPQIVLDGDEAKAVVVIRRVR
jgi:hypothetical protein